MGAWAPKAEQVAVAKFLMNENAVSSFLDKFKGEIFDRVNVFYKKFKELKNEGYNVDVIAPQASIFLTLKIDLTGYRKEDGTVIETTKDITNFLIEEAQIALVPFSSFGSSPDSKWFRVAVGTCTVNEIEEMIKNFKNTLSKLTKVD
jgi:aspartate aminotransferase